MIVFDSLIFIFAYFLSAGEQFYYTWDLWRHKECITWSHSPLMNNKRLLTGPKGNNEFCFLQILNVPQGKAEGNIEVESVLIEVDTEVESALIFHDFSMTHTLILWLSSLENELCTMPLLSTVHSLWT